MVKETKVIDGIGRIVVDRPNPECMDKIKEPRCGFCVWTVSNKVQYIGQAPATHLETFNREIVKKKSWSQIEREAVKVPAESFARIKESFINNCKKSGSCKQKIDRWRVKLDAVDSINDAIDRKGVLRELQLQQIIPQTTK